MSVFFGCCRYYVGKYFPKERKNEKIFYCGAMEEILEFLGDDEQGREDDRSLPDNKSADEGECAFPICIVFIFL